MIKSAKKDYYTKEIKNNSKITKNLWKHMQNFIGKPVDSKLNSINTPKEQLNIK